MSNKVDSQLSFEISIEERSFLGKQDRQSYPVFQQYELDYRCLKMLDWQVDTLPFPQIIWLPDSAFPFLLVSGQIRPIFFILVWTFWN